MAAKLIVTDYNYYTVILSRACLDHNFIMPQCAHAQARYIYSSMHVYACVCVCKYNYRVLHAAAQGSMNC